MIKRSRIKKEVTQRIFQPLTTVDVALKFVVDGAVSLTATRNQMNERVISDALTKSRIVLGPFNKM